MRLSFMVYVLVGTGCSVDAMEGTGATRMRDADTGSMIDAIVTVEPPTLGPLPSSTYWNSVPIQGHGPGGGTILVQSDTATTLTQPIQASGDFCVDAPLRMGAVTTFTLRAQDAAGNLSDAIQAHVEQSGAPPPPPEPGPSRNVARGGSAANNMYVSGGSSHDMIDGNLSTWLAGWDWNWGYDWVWVQLAERASIVKAAVYSSPDCTTDSYLLLLSDRNAPGDPSDTNPNWIRIADVGNGSGADIFTFQPATAKHMALYFWDSGCGSLGLQKHRIAELQAWTEPDLPPPPPTAPTCSDGVR